VAAKASRKDKSDLDMNTPKRPKKKKKTQKNDVLSLVSWKQSLR
jgi:hypothetical protein